MWRISSILRFKHPLTQITGCLQEAGISSLTESVQRSSRTSEILNQVNDMKDTQLPDFLALEQIAHENKVKREEAITRIEYDELRRDMNSLYGALELSNRRNAELQDIMANMKGFMAIARIIGKFCLWLVGFAAACAVIWASFKFAVSEAIRSGAFK